jgi:aldehyde dehydrogenase (NAD+)
MNAPTAPVRSESLRIGGELVACERSFEVRYPYTGEVVAAVPKATVADVRRALAVAKQFRSPLTRHDRYRILMRAGEIIASRRDEIARQITLESGLCLKDTLCESAAPTALRCSPPIRRSSTAADFSCDLTPHGKKRKVYVA